MCTNTSSGTLECQCINGYDGDGISCQCKLLFYFHTAYCMLILIIIIIIIMIVSADVAYGIVGGVLFLLLMAIVITVIVICLRHCYTRRSTHDVKEKDNM